MKMRQFHKGKGDNIGNDKIIVYNSRDMIGSIPMWLQYLTALAGVATFIWGIYTYYNSTVREMSINQIHYGTGDNIAGDKVVNEIKSFFSQMQSIKVLPPTLGGNDILNLDNVATLKLHVPYSITSVTLLLDIVPTILPDRYTEAFTVEGSQYYDHTAGTKYIFDTQENKRHEITVGGRTFIVTLLKVIKLEVENVPGAIEYQFGISKRE